MKDIEQTIKTLVEAKSGMTVSDPSQDLRGALGLDSLDIVEIIIDIDHEFGVVIPDESWEKANVATVQDMVNVVKQHLNR